MRIVLRWKEKAPTWASGYFWHIRKANLSIELRQRCQCRADWPIYKQTLPRTKKDPSFGRARRIRRKKRTKKWNLWRRRYTSCLNFDLMDFIIFYQFFYGKFSLYPILDLSQKLMLFYHFLYILMERWDSIPYLNSGITFFNYHSVSSNPTNLNNPPFTLPSHFKPTLTWTSFLSPAHFYPLL